MSDIDFWSPNNPPGWYRSLTPFEATKWFYFPAAVNGAVHTAWDGSRWEFDMLGKRSWDLAFYAPGSDDDRTPAGLSLDAGNPCHLRRWLEDTGAVIDGLFDGTAVPSGLAFVMSEARDKADLLDREQSESAQDRADRELAAEVASGWHIEGAGRDVVASIALAGIRAGREGSACGQ